MVNELRISATKRLIVSRRSTAIRKQPLGHYGRVSGTIPNVSEMERIFLSMTPAHRQTPRSHRTFSLIAICILALYTLAAILVSLNRFWQYEVFYYDFGIFDQAIWNVAHFRPPVIDHFVIGGKWIFADHFSPSMFLLAPLYWLTDRPEILLIAQAVAVGASGWVMVLLARRVLNNTLAALGIVSSYLLFIGTQNALIADIHEVTFMMLPLSIVFYAITTERKRLFWITFILTLGFKESAALLGVGIALLIFFYNRKWRKTALLVAVISLAWGILTTQHIIPFFYGRQYFYTPTWDTNPIRVLATLFDEPIKRRTVWNSLASFGFLPILHPLSWPLILQDLAARFMQKDFPLRWGMSLHYSAQMAVILAYSSIMGLHRLRTRFPHAQLLPAAGAILILLSLVLHRFVTRGPLGLAYNPAFYAHTKQFRFLNDLITQVPKGSSVMTMNNIAPHMIHTHQVYLLRAVYGDFLPEYFVLDLRSGQNFNNFFGADIEALKLSLPHDTRYAEYYRTADQVIYKRK